MNRDDAPLDPSEMEKLEEEWVKLQKGFQNLLELVERGCQGEQLVNIPHHMAMYTVVYNLCTNSKKDTGENQDKQAASAILYQRYGNLLTSYLMDRKITNKGKSPDMFLKEVVLKWQNHKLITRWLGKYFTYLDRYYTEYNEKDKLNANGLKRFFKEIYVPILAEIREAVFDRIQRERMGEAIDRVLLKEAISLYVEMVGEEGEGSLSVYTYDFEKPFVQASGEFYRREASRWVAEDSATEYLKKAEKRLKEEAARAQSYLHSDSDLIKEVEKCILAEQQKKLLEMENSGFIALLRDQRLQAIARAYRLFSRIPKGLEPMAQLLHEYVMNEGKAIVAKHSNSADLCFKAYTNDLLALHRKYRNILKDQLDDDAVFQKAVRDAFEAFVNQHLQCQNKGSYGGSKVSSSDLLASYCDMLMKNSTEKMGENELEEILEQVVSLFGYINDKDLFQEFSRKQLSKRLLMTTVNDDAERSLISKLKMRHGAPYTSHLEKMITDKNLSQDLQSKFKDWLERQNIKFGFEYTMQVLTTVSWPAFHIHPLLVPKAVQTAQERFRDFYNSRTQSRKLRWVHSLANVTLDAVFNKQKFQLQVTAFQACVLLLFNHTEALSGDDLVKELTLPWEETKKALQSLAMGKYKLLLKNSPEGAKVTKGVEETDTFQVNVDFTDKSRKLKIPTVVTKTNLKVAQQVQATVEEDRKHAIEACIVRIMKSRKQMEHPVLISECIAQLSNHFKPDPRHIKKRIEDLITREYIERDNDKQSLYRYVA